MSTEAALSLPGSHANPADPPQPEADGLPTPRRYAAVAAILGAIVLVVLDGAIANVALPNMTRALSARPADAVWIVTAYQLSIVMFLLPASAVGEWLGYRRLFAAGVSLFTAASVLCALSPSLPWLVAARCLQGLGSAAVMPLGLALLRFTYPKRLLGRAIAWNALAVAAASAAGPALGAVLLSVASWPWLFAVNLPLGLLVLAASTRLPSAVARREAPDLLSIALNAGAFGAIVLGCDHLVHAPLRGVALLALGLLFLTLLVRRERPKVSPLVPLDLLGLRAFRISVIASVCCFTGQMASYVALPFHFQHVLGLDALHTGLLMTPWPLAVMLAAPLSARLAERVSGAWLCAAGGGCLALGLGLCALWPVRGDARLALALFTAMAGLGFGFFQTPNNRNMLLAAPKERAGAAGGAQGAARLSGQTLGSLLMGLLFALSAPAQATRWGLLLAACCALAGGLVSLMRRPGAT